MFSTATEAGRFLCLCGVLIFAAACGDVRDDLVPSGTDRRGTVEDGTIGNSPGQIMEDFTLPTTEHGDFTLSDYLAEGGNPSDAVVFYLTMWCPICTGHQDRMLFDIMPVFAGRGAVRWVLIDYVSGSVAVAESSQAETGFSRTSFIVAVDGDRELTERLAVSMSSTLVVDASGRILMNETFRDGSRLMEILDGILPP